MRAEGSSVRAGRVAFATAFIGLFFDYYDLYLFVYLEKVLAEAFGLSRIQSAVAQWVGLSGAGLGALVFGYAADRFGRARVLLVVFGVYVFSIAGLSLSWNYGSLLFFRLLASMALGAEWGVSHSFIAERLPARRRYLFSALLQLSLLGGLLAALTARHLLPMVGWRWLFAFSLPPVIILSLVRFRLLMHAEEARRERASVLVPALKAQGWRFLVALGLAGIAIGSGTINIFFARELPQGTWFVVVLWLNVVPGMLLGAWVVRRVGVGWALRLYAGGLLLVSLFAYAAPEWLGYHAFALLLPLLNGIPFGLMGAWFNELFGQYRTLLSGTAYNLGRLLGAFAPLLITGLQLHEGGRYFWFTAAGAVVFYVLARVMRSSTSNDPTPAGLPRD